MKFIGRINLTKQELLDIIFRNETIALDPQIIDKFVKDSKKCLITKEKILEYVNDSFLSSSNLKVKSGQFDQNQLFVRAFLVVLLMVIASKKAQVRPEVAQFLVGILNSEIDFTKDTKFGTNPWSVLEIFYEDSAFAKDIQEKVENFGGFTQLNEGERALITGNIEKVYVFAIAIKQVEVLSRFLSFSLLSFAFYSESEVINSEFLQVYEKKSAFGRNISIVASILQNLLVNSNLKKSSPSSTDVTWVELSGQSKHNLNQLLNFVVEELSVEDIEGLKLKGSFDRTLQTLNFLSLSLVGSVTVQVQNTQQRVEQSCNAQKNEKYKGYLLSLLEKIKQQTEQNLQTLSYIQKNDGFGEEVPYILNFSQYIEPLGQVIDFEAFNAFTQLFEKNKQLNPPAKAEAPKEPKEEEKKAEGDDKKNKKQQKVVKVKKLGFGQGTAQIFELFQQQVKLGEIDEVESNQDIFVKQFFTVQNKDLIQLFEELTVSKNSERRKVKIAKGAQDFGGKEMALRRQVFNQVSQVFRDHGAVEIDTPVFELKETLTGKYGEDSKLIYDLEDQGGELLSLRYDLTVPFSRFMAQQNKSSIKRYQIQKVYRRDQPNIKRGRFREFFQCDFDISGRGDSMLQDAEVLKVFDTILTKLKLDKFVIKVNNRKILDAMIEISGAPGNKFKPICSAIDKLDKEPWTAVYKELVEEKGIAVEAVEKIGVFVNGKYTGKPVEVIEKLKADKVFEGNKKGEEALAEMTTLFNYLNKLKADTSVSFDLSLARGLDYYTGMIFEIVLIGEQVGSIAGGGRYDELIGMFMEKKDAIPSVGGSLGIERVYRILEARKELKKFTETEVLVCTIGNQAGEKLKIASELWDAGIKAEYLYKEKDKPQRQLEYAIYNNVPFTLWIGDSEIEKGIVKIKNMYLKEEKEYSREEYVDVLQKLIAQYYEDAQVEGKIEYYIEGEEQQQGQGQGQGQGKGKKEKQPKKKE